MAVSEKQKSYLKKIVPLSAFIGGLCCFTPVVMVLFGLSTVSFAASLSDVLYYRYAWAFQIAALLFFLLSIFWYFFKHEKICSLGQVKAHRNKILNMILLGIIFVLIAYVVWLYVIVEIIGIILGIWSPVP